jgi:hypothetical protein
MAKKVQEPPEVIVRQTNFSEMTRRDESPLRTILGRHLGRGSCQKFGLAFMRWGSYSQR